MTYYVHVHTYACMCITNALVLLKCVQNSGAELLEHEQNGVHHRPQSRDANLTQSLIGSIATGSFGQSAELWGTLECNFPIETLVTQLRAEDILTQFEYEEIRSTPNHIEKNRKFLDYLFRKNEAALEGTLSILDQPKYSSYHYLGDMLKDLFCCQRSCIPTQVSSLLLSADPFFSFIQCIPSMSLKICN